MKKSIVFLLIFIQLISCNITVYASDNNLENISNSTSSSSNYSNIEDAHKIKTNSNIPEGMAYREINNMLFSLLIIELGIVLLIRIHFNKDISPSKIYKEVPEEIAKADEEENKDEVVSLVKQKKEKINLTKNKDTKEDGYESLDEDKDAISLQKNTKDEEEIIEGEEDSKPKVKVIVTSINPIQNKTNILNQEQYVLSQNSEEDTEDTQVEERPDLDISSLDVKLTEKYLPITEINGVGIEEKYRIKLGEKEVEKPEKPKVIDNRPKSIAEIERYYAEYPDDNIENTQDIKEDKDETIEDIENKYREETEDETEN